MNNFQFNNPTKLIFGKDTVEKIGGELSKNNIKKVLFLYGMNSIKGNGVYETVLKSLQKANINFVELNGVKPNPILSKVNEAIEVCRKNDVDAILAVGGGSVVDSAKAIGAGVKYDGKVWDFFEGKARSKSSIPIYAILTLSATGSEMNPYGVITKDGENKKWAFGGSIQSFPVVSILDPSIQFGLPKAQTVNGAVDAIAHVLENYFDGTPQTDFQNEFSEGIVRTVMKHVIVLIKEPDNYESRAQLALCATMALNGLTSMGNSGGDWATHSIEHSLSAFYDIAHGAGLAILFPAWMKYCYKSDVKKFARLARNVFNVKETDDEEAALKGIEKFKKFLQQIGAPISLAQTGIPESDIEKIADNVSLLGDIGKLKRLDKSDVIQILKLAAKN